MHKKKKRQQEFKTIEDWLASRPLAVQQLAREFPIGDAWDIPQHGLFYVIGYTEDDRLVMSKIDPRQNYAQSYKQRVQVCADHLRGDDWQTHEILIN